MESTVHLRRGISNMAQHPSGVSQGILVLLGMLALTAVGLAQSQPPPLNGYLRTYIGALASEGPRGDYAVVQNTLDLHWEQKRGGKIGFYANPVLYHDQGHDPSIDIRFRQAYMDVFFDDFDLRVGKQQIIWGKADGVFITDIISPKDFQEFLLPDFDEIRIGVTATNLNYYVGDHTLQLIWVPVFQPNEFPEPDSLWAFGQHTFPMTPTWDTSSSTVPANVENSQVFGRFSALTSVIDVELMAGYLVDANPTYHITRVVDPATGRLRELIVRPEHHRLSIVGGSFAKTVSGVVLRGEGAFYRGKRFRIEHPSFADGTIENDFLHYLVGFDYNILGIDISGQFIQEAILDYHSATLDEQYGSTVTLLMREDFRRETLSAELFVYYGLNEGDALVRPKLTYDLADGFEVLLGANIFTGPQRSAFGQFDSNDMIYAKVKYSF